MRRQNSSSSVSIIDKFFQFGTDIMFMLDSRGTLLKSKVGCEKILGYEQSEFEGTKFLNYIHPDDTKKTHKVLLELLQNGTESNLINRFKHKNNSYSYLKWHFFSNERNFYAIAENTEDHVQVNEFFKASIDNAAEEIYWINADGAFEYVNKIACKNLGYSKEELLRLTVFDIHPEISKDSFRDGWTNHKKNKIVQSVFSSTFEAINKRKDGTFYPVEVSTNHLLVESKVIQVSHVHDISDRKKKENKLLQSEQKYRMLFENMTNSFVLHEIIFDNDGNPIDYIYVEVNPVFELYTGYKASFVQGKKASELHPNMEDYWLPFFGGVVKTGKSKSIIRYAKELDKYFEAFAFKTTDNYCAAIFNDVTDRVKNNEILRKFKASIDYSFYGVFWVNEHSGFDYVNEQACKMLGYSHDELMQLTIMDIDPNADPIEFEKLWSGFHERKSFQFYTIESAHKKKDGTIFPIEINTVFIWKADKGFLLASVKDISERKEYEASILKSQKLLDESQRIAQMGSWEMDLHKKTIIWSDSTYKLFGVEKDDKPLNTGDFFDLVHPADTAVLENQFKKTREYERTENNKFRIIRPDGKVRVINATAELIRINGEPSKIMGVVQDVTDKEKANKALKESEQKMQTLFKIVPAGIGIVADRIITEANPELCRITGYSKEELIGKNTLELYPSEEEYLRIADLLYNKKGQIGTLEMESFCKRKDGSQIATFLTSAPIDPNDLKKGLTFSVFDITERKQREEALIKSQKILQESQRIAKLGSWELDLLTNDLFWNEGAFQIYGFEFNSIKPSLDAFFDLVHPDDLEFVKKHLVFSIENRSSPDLECRIITPSGEKKSILIVNELVLDKNKRPVLIYGIVQDISEQKKHEEQLIEAKEKAEESKQRYKVLHDASFGGIFIHDGRIILDCNQGLSDMTGYTREELIGMDGYNLILEKYRSIVAEKVKAGLQNSYEAIGIRKNGEEYPIRIDGRNIPYKNGHVRCVEFRDITEQKQIEAEILKAKERAEESEFFLKESQRCGNIGSYKLLLKEDLWISTEVLNQIFGITELFTKTSAGWLEIVHPDDRDMMDNYLRYEVIGKLQPFNKEYRIVRKSDNETRWVHGLGKLFFDKDGNLKEMLGTIQDVTDRMHIEEERRMMNIELEKRVRERTIQLQKANNDLEAFAYSVSHDLRAPVRHIDGFMHLLENAIGESDEKTRNYIRKVYLSNNNMSSMIEELLQFSRLGRADLKTSSVNLSDIVEGIVARLKPDYTDRNIQWNISRLPTVDGDPGLLKIAFENIISNAIKYTLKEKQAIITIEDLGCEGDSTCVMIKDNGIGFDMANKHKLFMVFQRLHKDDQFEGIGIGLANVKRIIDRHNGKVDAESEINKGASFYITLPLHRDN